jgi:hypothetical protein
LPLGNGCNRMCRSVSPTRRAERADVPPTIPRPLSLLNLSAPERGSDLHGSRTMRMYSVRFLTDSRTAGLWITSVSRLTELVPTKRNLAAINGQGFPGQHNCGWRATASVMIGLLRPTTSG